MFRKLQSHKLLTPPEGVEVFESPIATYWIESDGFMYGVSKDVVRTIENLKENFALIRKITDNKKSRLLMDLSEIPPEKQETREYAQTELPQLFKAIAIISSSSFGKTVANIFISLKKHDLPMKVFNDEPAAKEWLKKF